MELTIRAILQRSDFQDTEIVAGNKGLNRKVKWVHIVEIENFGHLLHGRELILSTGSEWANDKEKSLYYLQQLLDFKASGLCIDLNGRNQIQSLPTEMLKLAEQNDFPIILFNQEVKFIDITKDIHELLLGYQENFWWELENLNKDFNHILVSNGPIEAFLKKLHLTTKKQVVLVHDTGEYWFFPSPTSSVKQKIKTELKTNKNHMDYDFTSIYFLNEQIAQLYTIEDTNISLFNQLAIKRCSEFLAQYFWKHRQQTEIHKVKKNEWILDALRGEISSEETMMKMLQENTSIQLNEVSIAVFPSASSSITKQNDESFFTETLMFIRTIFKNEGYHLLATKDHKRNHFILLLINQRKQKNMSHRLKRALNKINNLNVNPSVSENLKWLSFGKTVKNYDQVQTSYQTALSTLHFQKNIQKLEEPFYHNLALYRLVEQISDTNELEEIINDYIGPLLDHDFKKGTELLKSLQIYLKNLGSKNETARELFIVRQTLYHRLNKIKELLGEDYIHPENRVMIEFAIYAKNYLEMNGLKPLRV
ncbi:PucR family transcriptional regulator [Virgibacillus alimentarius]|uniref:PucR family transcriptional regulator n=1 Tax=Virgibacillus alimentarius TaxID=698769 RepID=UPI0004937BB9|nr:PucR family transcriptional regulator [Virgibacillus alimentarius]